MGHRGPTQATVTASETPVETGSMMAIFRSFRHRDFALFWSGNFLSNIGSWMQNLALGWLIVVTTNSPFLLGLNGFLISVPALLFSLPGGAIADRMNRRKLLTCTQTALMLLALALAVLTSFHVVTIREILLISFLSGLASALNNPTYQALVPELVEREDLMNAVALNSAQFNMSRAIGPTLAGLALGTVGAAGCFYLNTISFLPLILILFIIMVPSRPAEERPSMWGFMLDGLRYVWKNRFLITLLSVPAFLSLFALPFITLMPYFAKNDLRVNASGLGYLMAGAGVGAVIAAFTLAARVDFKHKGRYIFACAAGFSVCLIFLSQARTFWPAFFWMILCGGTMVGGLALTNTTLQLASPPELRGRIMSLYNLAVMGLAPFGNLQAGAVAEAFGTRFALMLAGTICLIYFLALLLVVPWVRRSGVLP